MSCTWSSKPGSLDFLEKAQMVPCPLETVLWISSLKMQAYQILFPFLEHKIWSTLLSSMPFADGGKGGNELWTNLPPVHCQRRQPPYLILSLHGLYEQNQEVWSVFTLLLYFPVNGFVNWVEKWYLNTVGWLVVGFGLRVLCISLLKEIALFKEPMWKKEPDQGWVGFGQAVAVATWKAAPNIYSKPLLLFPWIPLACTHLVPNTMTC